MPRSSRIVLSSTAALPLFVWDTIGCFGVLGRDTCHGAVESYGVPQLHCLCLCGVPAVVLMCWGEIHATEQ